MVNKAKYYYKINKERLRRQARYKYRNLSEEEKIKRKNMGKIDTTICLKKKTKKISKKNFMRQEKHNISSVFCCYLRHTNNIIINRIVF